MPYAAITVPSLHLPLSMNFPLLCRYIILLSNRLVFDWMSIFVAFHFPILFLFFRFHFIGSMFFINIAFSHGIREFSMENPMWWATFVPFHLNAELSISKAGEQTTSVSVRWLPNNQHWLNENGSRLCSYYVLFILIVMSIVFYCGHCSEIVLVHRRCSFFIVAHFLLFCPTFCIQECSSNSYDLSSGLHLIIFFSFTVPSSHREHMISRSFHQSEKDGNIGSKLKSERRSMKFNELPNEFVWNWMNDIRTMLYIRIQYWRKFKETQFGSFDSIWPRKRRHGSAMGFYLEILIQLHALWQLMFVFTFRSLLLVFGWVLCSSSAQMFFFHIQSLLRFWWNETLSKYTWWCVCICVCIEMEKRTPLVAMMLETWLWQLVPLNCIE